MQLLRANHGGDDVGLQAAYRTPDALKPDAYTQLFRKSL